MHTVVYGKGCSDHISRSEVYDSREEHVQYILKVIHQLTGATILKILAL